MRIKTDLFLGIRNFLVYKNGRLTPTGLIRAVLGIGLSMIPLIVVLEVSSGMIEGITRRYVEVGSHHFQIRKFADTDGEGVAEVIESLKDIECIRFTTPMMEGQGLLFADGGRTGVQIRGIDSSSYQDDKDLQRYLVLEDGEFDFGENQRGLVISRVIADKLDVAVGDDIKLLVSRTSPSGGKPILRPGTYTVMGITSTGYQELDALSIYMDLDRAGRIFRQDGSHFLAIKVDNYIDDVNQTKYLLADSVPSGWYVLSWYDLNQSLYRNLSSTKTMLLFIMALIIIVAAVNISSTILNLVMERQEQIAVMKSMGASPGQIERQFVFTGFIIGLFGVLFGMIFGLALAVNINEAIHFLELLINYIQRFFWSIFPFLEVNFNSINILNSTYYLEKIPIKIPLVETFLIGFLTLTLCTFASVIPARRAGKIKPLEIFRKHG